MKRFAFRWFRSLAARCQDDHRLASILGLGGLTSATVLPIGLMRLAAGQTLMGVIDLTVAAAILANAGYAWRGGSTDVAGTLLVVCCSLGVAAASAWTGAAGLLWSYLVLVGNFMLADRRIALAANTLLIAASPFINDALSENFTLLAFLATSVLLTLHTFGVIRWAEQQRDRLNRMASMDPLTGAPNRRSMELELREAVLAHQRLGLPAALAVLDLDHFKRVNDTHGHEAGDRVLVAFTQLVQGSIRKRDRLFRFGGEEFVLLLPSTSREGVEVALRKLCTLVREQLQGPDAPIQVSIGASMLREGDDWPTWLCRADAELYQAKQSGRNRVCTDTLDAGDLARCGTAA